MRRIVVLLAAAVPALLAAGCGDDEPAAVTTAPPLPPAATAPTPATTTSASEPQAPQRRTTVFMLREGKVFPVARAIGATAGPGAASLRSLLQGVTDSERADGITTAIPAGTRFRSLNIKGLRATADFSQPLGDAATAQVVHTLTTFQTVNEVQLRVQGKARGPVWQRRDLENFAPQILIQYPLRGDTVTSPLQITGTANTFEATFTVRVLGPDGKTLTKQTVTASSGSGTRGDFAAALRFDKPAAGQPLTLYAFEPSAEDGRPLHEVRVPLIAG